MSQAFLGQIMLFGFNFAPRGYAQCNGQLMAISQNAALFSLLGTTYGGNGTTTFGLPDLRGRVPSNQGQGPGLTNRVIGEVSGSETITLLASQMPTHAHGLANVTGKSNVRSGAGNQRGPAGHVLAAEAAGVTAMYSDLAPDATLATGSVTLDTGTTTAVAGSGLPVAILPPYLVMNYCIAVEGIFPSRN